MRTIRVYVDQPLQCESRIVLNDAASHYLLRVLRLRDDACVQLFNGDGYDYLATLFVDKNVVADIAGRQKIDSESPLQLKLAQAICRGEKMDLVIQKAVELGVMAIQPLFTDRTEVKLDSERAERRLAHWRSVAWSACEQSGRAQVPAIAEPLDLLHWLSAMPPLAEAGCARLMLDPAGEHRIRSLPSNTQQAILIVGPEGGLSDRDLQKLAARNFVGLNLGPRILRTETAGLAALAALQQKFGDL
jgi:16S rRNA (uracil1498-N3)-methyltransferase